MVGEAGTLLCVWSDVACFWRCPKFSFEAPSGGVVRAVLMLSLVFLLFSFCIPVVLFHIYGIGGVILGLVTSIFCCSYFFTLPSYTPKPFLLVSLEVIPLMEHTPKNLDYIKMAIQSCTARNFRKHFRWLAQKSQNRAYEALRDAPRQNRQQLTAGDLEELIHAKHPELRQEAIRLLGYTTTPSV